MTIRIIREPISMAELAKMAETQFGDFVKAVVDVEQSMMAIGGELHADEETILLENGSQQNNLWGINIYPRKSKKEWIEFDSMINVRPSQSNRSRGVDDAGLRAKIEEIAEKLIRNP